MKIISENGVLTIEGANQKERIEIAAFAEGLGNSKKRIDLETGDVKRVYKKKRGINWRAWTPEVSTKLVELTESGENFMKIKRNPAFDGRSESGLYSQWRAILKRRPQYMQKQIKKACVEAGIIS
jgi:hypothetical protein